MLVAVITGTNPGRGLLGNFGSGELLGAITDRLGGGQPLLIVPLAFAAHRVRNLVQDNLHGFIHAVNVNEVARNRDGLGAVVTQTGTTLTAVETKLPDVQV